MKNTLSAFALLVPLVSTLHAQSPQPRVPEGVTIHRDLAYVEGGHERQKLDLYLPARNASKGGALPLIVWIHGGGWQSGSKEQCLPLRSGVLERGYAVASIGYRLSGHATFPAQIEDCKAAVRWLRAHAGKYGLDRERFGAWGSSAGGHLAALLGASGGVKAFEVGAHLDESSRVQAVCDYFGPTDLTAMASTPGYERHAGAGSAESKLLGGAVLEDKARAERASVLAYVTADDPPFLIVHGDEDRVVPAAQGQLLFAALKKAGVSARLHTIHNAGHGGPAFSANEIEQMVSAFFDERLKERVARVDASATESTAAFAPRRRKAFRGGGERRESAAAASETKSAAGVAELRITGGRWKCVADGEPLEGVVFKPEGRGPFPGIVINHGLGANAEQFAQMKAREFVKWGFACIATDLTHSRPGPGADRTRFGASAENLRRARACVAILRSLPEVDAKRICAYGNSMGAFLTIALVAEMPGEFAAAAITAGGVVPVQGYAAPPAETAARIRTPMLILHGSLDTTVPAANSARLKVALDANGTSSERHVFEGAGHGLHSENADEVYRRMREWFTAQGVLN